MSLELNTNSFWNSELGEDRLLREDRDVRRKTYWNSRKEAVDGSSSA